VTGQWSGGFQAEVAVRNPGSVPLTGWRVTWTIANGQTISQLWNGNLTTSGAGVAVNDVGYNASVPVNGSTTFGFLGSWNGTNGVPVATCTAL
jgi:endoglucanase